MKILLCRLLKILLCRLLNFPGVYTHHSLVLWNTTRSICWGKFDFVDVFLLKHIFLFIAKIISVSINFWTTFQLSYIMLYRVHLVIGVNRAHNFYDCISRIQLDTCIIYNTGSVFSQVIGAEESYTERGSLT